MAIFSKNFENHIYGEFVKIQEFTIVMIYMIFLQKLKFWNFLEFSLIIGKNAYIMKNHENVK